MVNIDLNLLRIFDILYDERSVTRAAAHLFFTQSAVSHALARLREVLGDPLFLRIPSGLQPTERAQQLAPRLRVALAEIRSAVAPPMFDPAKTRQHFVIAAGSDFLHADRSQPDRARAQICTGHNPADRQQPA